ncbi:transposase, partial [Glycomyces sp. L485]|uniref:transposase n=1 Tax=Glycomyces sp. L485 TaxID=2909235 RepID=UPI001F4BBAEA
QTFHTSAELDQALGMTIADIARKLNVTYESVRTWVRKAKATNAAPAPEGGEGEPSRAELITANADLAKRLREAEKVIEVLKASTAFFASEIRRSW